VIQSLLLTAAVGCAGPRHESVEPLEMAPPSLLQPLPPRETVNGAVVPLPADFRRAQVEFDRARAAYGSGHFAAAARGFLQAARTFRAIQGWEDTDSPLGNRRISYENAMSAFFAAKDLEGGRQALTAVAREDPPCADQLQQLAHKLEEWLRPPPP
jgi:hypothetical protein